MASGLVGKTLSNRYVIEEMLGQGGMSAVYKATDPNLKRVVAVKVIHAHLSSDKDFVKRFEEEAAAVAQLRHPGIIQVHDFNQDDDTYYMVLEFVPGETFQDHLKRLNDSGRKLSPAKAAEYMAAICDSVDYAHQRGMVHRDIKPANLMLNTLGQAILMDFGIAKIVGSQRHTATGAVVGTAMYMSPEQIKGEQPDRRTDIYSLGVTLYEMVGGRPPFEADSAMTLMMMHMHDPVPNVKNLNPDVPDSLVAVINKSLAKDPNDRYQTAAQMAAALRNIHGRSPSMTAVEDATMNAARKSTTVEKPYVGTVVESAPRSSGVKGTVVESPAQSSLYSTPAAPPQTSSAPARKTGLALPIIAVVVIGLICVVGGGALIANQLFGGGSTPTEPPLAATDTLPATEIPLVVATEATATLSVTDTPAVTATPSVPPGIPFVRINSITIDGNNYAINFETFEYTPQLPGMHVHFFWNTVSPQNAGSPGSGPWDLYGGPSPYTGLSLSERPSAATQICALVANGNHSIQPNSGTCVDLP
ncbi:MAG TPA: serine/threonine-protein kinase [Anaerolineales bacterium]|nr:serine/threonine-protein kinase [Anaerolineales bacterium]